MSEAIGFNRIQRSAVANDAIEMIKAMILKGDLVANQRMPSERELAEMFGVSRPTLRESIRALIALNILESRHGEGTFVTSLDPGLLSEPIDFVLQLSDAQLRDLTEARSIFEPAATVLAGRRMTPEALDRLEAIANELEEGLEDIDAAIRLDSAFHRLISETSGNAILITLAGSISALTRASRERTAQGAGDRVSASRELHDIVAAFRAGDPEAAGQAMKEHIEHIARALETTV
ncbi:MAG: FadR family transcriptional regulator [Chloroflexi bacterium]|nr:FadR family transcriptional regulator [Chloroflexota bacterium]